MYGVRSGSNQNYLDMYCFLFSVKIGKGILETFVSDYRVHIYNTNANPLLHYLYKNKIYMEVILHIDCLYMHCGITSLKSIAHEY